MELNCGANPKIMNGQFEHYFVNTEANPSRVNKDGVIGNAVTKVAHSKQTYAFGAGNVYHRTNVYNYSDLDYYIYKSVSVEWGKDFAK